MVKGYDLDINDSSSQNENTQDESLIEEEIIDDFSDSEIIQNSWISQNLYITHCSFYLIYNL